MQLHAPNITVTTAHIKSPQFLLALAWWWLPMADVSLPLGSRTVLSLSFSLLTNAALN
jgi:hypothetical protein